MRFRVGTFALACAVLSPVVAKADDFSLTGQGFTISFTLPETPSPDASQSGVGFVIDNVAVDVNGTTYTTDVGFGTGLPTLFIGTGPSLSPSGVIHAGTPSWGFYTGDPLYTGSESSPTFVQNTYTLSNIEGLVSGGAPLGDYSLAITPSSPVTSSVTPEPSSFVMLGTGLLGAVGVARRRWAM